MKSDRHVLVVDCETNGLDPARHQAVEIAWWNLDTDERGAFIPQHDVSKVLAAAEVKALQVNRYVDRIADRVPVNDTREANQIREQLNGCTLAGSNPAFDAAMLAKWLRPSPMVLPEAWRRWSPPWHYRLLDLSALAAGMLVLDELPGLSSVCELLGVDPGDHTAEGDVTATGECFKKLFARRNSERELTVGTLP